MENQTTSDVTDFLLRVQELGQKTWLEDELRTQKLERDILERRRRRQALRENSSSGSLSPNKLAAVSSSTEYPADSEASISSNLNHPKRTSQHVSPEIDLSASPTSSSITKERVVSRKEQQIIDTIESLVGPAGTLSLNFANVNHGSTRSSTDKQVSHSPDAQSLSLVPTGGGTDRTRPAVTPKPRHLSGNYGNKPSTAFIASESHKISTDLSRSTESTYSLSHSMSTRLTNSRQPEANFTAASPRSPSPTKPNRSPTRGGFIQSALLKREGTLSRTPPRTGSPVTPSWRHSANLSGSLSNAQSAQSPSLNGPTTVPSTAASLYSSGSPVVFPRPDYKRRSPSEKSQSAAFNSDKSEKSGVPGVENEVETRPSRSCESSPPVVRDDSRRWSPERKKTWLESALNKEPGVRSRSPSPVKSFAESPRPKSALLPGSGGIYSPATPLVSLNRPSTTQSSTSQSKDTFTYAGISSPSLGGSTSQSSLRNSVGLSAPGHYRNGNNEASWKNSATARPDTEVPSWKRNLTSLSKPDNDIPDKKKQLSRDQSIEELASGKKNSEILNQPSDDNLLETKIFSTLSDRESNMSSIKQNEIPSWRTSTNLSNNLLNKESLDRLSSLPAPESPKDIFPTLRPTNSVNRKREEPVAPALQRLATLKTPPPKPLSSNKPAEALERLKSLRSSSPVRKPLRDETKEAIEQAKRELKRSNTTKYQAPDELKDAVLSTRDSLRRSPTRSPERQELSRTIIEEVPEQTQGKPASFQNNLESMLKRGRPGGPHHSPSNPSLAAAMRQEPTYGLRKSRTIDNSEASGNTTNKNLKHLTKSRAKGPKRRLPRNAASTTSSQLSLSHSSPSRLAAGALYESQTLNISKSGSGIPGKSVPPKPRKPSSSVKAVGDSTEL